MKKLIASLFSAAVLFGAAPLGAAALDPLHTVEQDGVTYSFAVSDGNAEIVSVSGAKGSITIPSKLETYSVTAIGDKAFLGQTRKSLRRQFSRKRSQLSEDLRLQAAPH